MRRGGGGKGEPRRRYVDDRILLGRGSIFIQFHTVA